MGTVINILTLLVVSLFVAWEVFEKVHTQPVKEIKPSHPQRVEYSLTLEGNMDFLKLLLDKNWYFSYSDGKVFLLLPDKGAVKEVLNLYGKYLTETRKRKFARYTVRNLIKLDMEKVREKLLSAENNYGELYNLLKERGIKVSFEVFGDDIKNLRRKIFEAYNLYWEKKYEQLLNGFKEFVKEPSFDFAYLIQKAETFYGNDLKVRLFKLFLNKVYYETRLEADLFKYREYGGKD